MTWYIAHSAKGSEWEGHKYVKREGTKGKLEDTGKYYYPDSYKGGRHSDVYQLDNNYLAHHGILGMKWGKRNGPPYPLGAGDHSASEKKAGWRQSLFGSKTDTRNAASKMTDDELKKSIQRKSLEKQYNKLNGTEKSDLEKVRDLTDATRGATNQAYNILTSEKVKKKKMDLSNMTDKEIRDKINREYLEMQYTDLFGEPEHPYIERGKQTAKVILKGASIYLTFASTVLGIAYLATRL